MREAPEHGSSGSALATAEAWARRPEWGEVPRTGLDDFSQVVVVAAHPDDEALGAGGLTATAAAAGLDVHLVVCTAHEHLHTDSSHPSSPNHEPEVCAALRALAPDCAITLVHLRDGRVAGDEQTLVELLVRLLGDAHRTLVVAPWRHDLEADHDAAGRAAATAARHSGATLWEYPLWWWHRARPDEAPWPDLRMLPLSDDAVARRAAALRRFDAHCGPSDEEAALRTVAAEYAGRHETFVVRTLDAEH